MNAHDPAIFSSLMLALYFQTGCCMGWEEREAQSLVVDHGRQLCLNP
jgi:hypothetical protein